MWLLVSERKKAWRHYSDVSQAKNAEAFTRYLAKHDLLRNSGSQVLYNAPIAPTSEVGDLHVATNKKLRQVLEKYGWMDANNRFQSETVCDGRIRGTTRVSDCSSRYLAGHWEWCT